MNGMWRLKILSMLLGEQGGIGNTCAFCVENEHWICEQWPKRNEFAVGEKNICNESLSVSRQSSITTALYQARLNQKQYVKSLEKVRECFKCICQKFLFLSHEKI